MGTRCAVCAGDPDPGLFEPLCPVHYAAVPLPTPAEIDASLERGRADMEAAASSAPSLRLSPLFFR